MAVTLAPNGCRDSTGTTPRLHQRWYKSQSGYAYARPTTSGTLVFFGTGDGKVIAREQSTGNAVWSVKAFNDPVEGANLVAQSGVVVVAAVRSTAGIDIASGRQLWSYNAPLDTLENAGTNASPGGVANTHLDTDSSTVYVPAWGASVSAVDLHTGAARWVWEPGRVASDTAVRAFRSGSQGVTVSGDTVFATMWHFRDAVGLASDGWLVALDRLTGRELWRVGLPPYTGGTVVWGRPAIAGNLAIFDGRGGHVFAIDRTTQQLAWENHPNSQNATFAQVEYMDGVLYFDGGDHFVDAARASDGTVLWRAPFSSQALQDLLVTPNRVYFSDGSTLYVLDRATGRQILTAQQPYAGNSLFASPAAFANGHIFVTVNDGAWSFDEP